MGNLWELSVTRGRSSSKKFGHFEVAPENSIITEELGGAQGCSRKIRGTRDSSGDFKEALRLSGSMELRRPSESCRGPWGALGNSRETHGSSKEHVGASGSCRDLGNNQETTGELVETRKSSGIYVKELEGICQWTTQNRLKIDQNTDFLKFFEFVRIQ